MATTHSKSETHRAKTTQRASSQGQAADKVAEKAHQAADRLAQATAAAEQAWADMSGKMQTQSHDLNDSVTQYVKEKPFAALGFAALAGAVIATLLRK